MPRTLALDPGDQHVGTALSDELGMLAEPYRTVTPDELESFLDQIIPQESISTIVIGYPKTMRGTISAQTQKSIDLKDQLACRFPDLKLVLWDERLTSQSAARLKKSNDKASRLHQHSIAAAIILQTYLDSSYFLAEPSEE
jgi:putative Holliday junction resolvase